MRLTLRTLLAFMDDILEPQDQEDLARQIEESEKGTELIHRTRDAMRRLRLGAPPVLGQGMELDPNFTSEYLDSTLSSEQMTDYQQVCLDSDVHLAEVASCHHILTMVLGEPAEIDPEMRRHMYGIPQRMGDHATRRLDAPHTPAPAAAAAAAPAAASPRGATPAAVAVEQPTTEVPEYLRAASRARSNRLLVAGLALLVLGAGVWFLFGPNGLLTGDGQVARNQPAPPTQTSDPANVTEGGEAPLPAPSSDTTDGVVAGETAAGQPTTGDTSNIESDTIGQVIDPDQPAGVAPVSPPPVGPPPIDEAPMPEGTTTDTPPTTDDQAGADTTFPGPIGPIPPPPTSTGPPIEPPPTDEATGGEPSATPPGDATAAPPLLPPQGGEGEVMQPAPGPAEGQAATVAPTPSGAPVETVPPLDNVPSVASNTPVEPAPSPAVGPIPPVPGTTATTTTPDAAAPTPSAPAAPSPLGTLTSPKDILLRYDPAAEQWNRVKVNTALPAGTRLMSLPTYRPSIALTSGLRLELSDGTMVELDRGSDASSVVLNLTYGRVLMVNVGAAPVKVELHVGETVRGIEIEPARLMAVEISRPFTPGQAADQQQAVVGMVYVPQGGVVWSADGVPTPIDGSAQWAWNDGPATKQPFDEEVTWLAGQNLDLLDRNASWNIEQTFDTQRPAGEQLLEFYLNSRRREEKVLAAKCSTHVGQFVPFVDALADTNQRSNWDSHIEDLRSAMARSPELAEQVYQTLQQQRGSVPGMADDLFEMLRGYSRDQLGSTPEEIKAGVLRKLIGWLGHDRLEYRVLAFHNLRQLTGGKTFMYNPAETDAERRNRNIRRWEQMLADNELVKVEAAPAAPGAIP